MADSGAPSPATGGGELGAKFQRLLQEYTKVKSQNAILKKAVLQEQQRTKEATSKVKEQDVALREAMEKNELLLFNNERLTKRIGSLQAQLSDTKKTDGASWFSGSKSVLKQKELDLEVATQELGVKIEENERLHIQMFDLRRANKAALEQVEQQLQQVRKTLAEKQEEVENAAKRHKAEIEKIHSENRATQLKAEQLEESFSRTTAMLNKRTEEFSALRKELEADLDKAQDLIERRIAFDDTALLEFNKYNVPSSTSKLAARVDANFRTGLRHLQGTVDGLRSLFGKMYEQRGAFGKARATSRNAAQQQVVQLNKKIQEVLQKSHAHLQAVFDGFLALDKCRRSASTVGDHDRKVASAANDSLVAFLFKLADSFEALARAMDEDGNIANVSRMHCHALVERLRNFAAAVKAAFATLQPIFEEVQMEEAEEEEFARTLHRAVLKCQEVSLDLFKVLSAEPETTLLPAEWNSSQEQIQTGVSGLLAAIANHLQFPKQPLDMLVRGSRPAEYCHGSLAKQAASFAAMVNSCCDWESVRYDEAIKNVTFIREVEAKKADYEAEIALARALCNEKDAEHGKTLLELSATKDSLASKQSQVNSLMSELAAVRSRCEQLAAGAVSLVAAEGDDIHAKPSLSSEELSEGLETILAEDSPATTPAPVAPKSGYSMVVVDENGRQSNSLEVTQVDREREAALKQHYKAQRAQLLGQMKIADGKAQKYHEEYERVARELQQSQAISLERKTNLENTLAQLKAAKEDVDSTRNNYQDQMQVLTEHLVQLNEKLSKQQESIDRLKGHKVQCGRCGIWNTVAWLVTEGGNGRRCSRGNHASSYNFA